MEVATAKRKNNYDQNQIRSIAGKKNIEIAIVNDSWFDNNIPAEWSKAGEWKIMNNVVCGGDTVSIGRRCDP